MQSKARTVQEYLAELPADRRAILQAVRNVILKNLDERYGEGMSYGMIGYYVPHSVYPAGYHCDPKLPLPFAGLASQKNHMSLYIMSTYDSPSEEKWLRDQFAKAGKKLDMGKCCVRFKKLEDLPLDVIGEAIRRVPVERHIEFYETNFRGARGKGSSRAAGTAKKPPARRAAAKKKDPAKARKTAKARKK